MKGDPMMKIIVYAVLTIMLASCSTQQNSATNGIPVPSGVDDYCNELQKGNYSMASDRCQGFKTYCQQMGADSYWGQPSCSNQAYNYCAGFDTGSASCTYSWWCGSSANWYIANLGGCFDPYGNESFCLRMDSSSSTC